MKKLNIVLAYMEEHIYEDIPYAVLANIVGYSVFYFHRIFTMLFGITVGEYIRKRRLTMAATLLKARYHPHRRNSIYVSIPNTRRI